MLSQQIWQKHIVSVSFQEKQANERELQGLLTVLLSNIQCFCYTRTFSCCCIFLSYILFSPIERSTDGIKHFSCLHCILMDMQKNKRCNEFPSFLFLVRNYLITTISFLVRSSSCSLCLLSNISCIRWFSFFPFCPIMFLYPGEFVCQYFSVYNMNFPKNFFFLICQALVEILNIQALKIYGYLQNCKFVCVTKSLQAPVLLLGMRTSAAQWQHICVIHYLAFNKDCSVFWKTGTWMSCEQGELKL